MTSKKLLEPFFKEPEKEFYFRELMKKVRMSPNDIKKEIDTLLEKNILTLSGNYGKMKLYKANKDSFDFNRLKKAYNISKVINSDLMVDIKNNYDPQSAILFGDYNHGEDDENSTINLLLLASKKTPKTTDFLDQHHKSFERKVKIHNFKAISSLDEPMKSHLLNGTLLHGKIDYTDVFMNNSNQSTHFEKNTFENSDYQTEETSEIFNNEIEEDHSTLENENENVFSHKRSIVNLENGEYTSEIKQDEDYLEDEAEQDYLETISSVKPLNDSLTNKDQITDAPLKIDADLTKAKNLLKKSHSRLKELKTVKSFVSNDRIFEMYHESIKEMIGALMFSEGLKPLEDSHFLNFALNKFKEEFDENQANMIKELFEINEKMKYEAHLIDGYYMYEKEEEILNVIGSIFPVVSKSILN